MTKIRSIIGSQELVVGSGVGNPIAKSLLGLGGKGYLLVHNSFGTLVWTSPFVNLITNVGLNYILNNALSTATVYLGAIASNGTNTASVSSSSTAVTLGTAASWSANQHLTIVGAGTSGANLADQASGSGSTSTSLTLSSAAGTTVSSATLIWGPTFAAGDTSSSHSGWTEVASSQVTNSTRPQWVQNGAASAQSVSNSSSSTNLFTLASTAPTQYWAGFFLIDNDTWGGTSGNLVSEFVPTAGAMPLGPSYTVSLSYSISASSSSSS